MEQMLKTLEGILNGGEASQLTVVLLEWKKLLELLLEDGFK